MNNIDYNKLGAIGAEAAQKAMKTWHVLTVSKNHSSWENDEPARTAYAEAVVRAYLEQVGEGFPSVEKLKTAFTETDNRLDDIFTPSIESIRSLMLASFARKMEAVAKLPEKWRSVVTGAGFQSVYATCAINLEDALSLPAVEVEPAEKWAQEKAAFAQGRKIECRNRASNGDPWTSWSAITAKEMIFFTHSLVEYRIAPDQPSQPGKITDEELGEIGALAALTSGNKVNWLMSIEKDVSTFGARSAAWRGDKPMRTAFAHAVREAVEKEQAEKLAFARQKINKLQQEIGRAKHSDDGYATIASQRDNALLEIARLTAELERQTKIHCALEDEREVNISKLATVTAERDRLLPRPVSTAPTEADANNDGRVLLLGDGNSATFAAIANWGYLHTSWRRWIPLNLAAYGVQTAKQVERERFEKAMQATFQGGWLHSFEKTATGEYFTHESEVGFRVWQAARAVKEGE